MWKSRGEINFQLNRIRAAAMGQTLHAALYNVKVTG